MTRLSDIEYLKLSCEIAKRSREKGNHPFGCLLVDEEGNVVLEAENTCETERDMTGHAETNLMRMASKQFEPDFLWKCTLYTNIEPCAMCSGAAYWVGVGRIVYGLPENWLLDYGIGALAMMFWVALHGFGIYTHRLLRPKKTRP